VKRNFSQFILALSVGVLVASWIALPSFAQRGGIRSPVYDPKTEVTVKGSVEAVNQFLGPQGWAGTHLSLKTDKETLDVHVGPSWYLTQQKINFAKGDQVEVTGSRIKWGNNDALLAREVKKSGQTIMLRNSQGIPAWSRSPRRLAP
jgi:hypothetical protein